MATSTIKGEKIGSRTILQTTTFPWTAPSDGFLTVRIHRTNSAGQVTFYVRDDTGDASSIMCIDNYVPANFQVSQTAPVKANHKYTQEYSSGVGSIDLIFTPLE